MLSVCQCPLCPEFFSYYVPAFFCKRTGYKPTGPAFSENFTKISRQKWCEKRKISRKFHSAGAQRGGQCLWFSRPNVWLKKAPKAWCTKQMSLREVVVRASQAPEQHQAKQSASFSPLQRRAHEQRHWPFFFKESRTTEKLRRADTQTPTR